MQNCTQRNTWESSLQFCFRVWKIFNLNISNPLSTIQPRSMIHPEAWELETVKHFWRESSGILPRNSQSFRPEGSFKNEVMENRRYKVKIIIKLRLTLIIMEHFNFPLLKLKGNTALVNNYVSIDYCQILGKLHHLVSVCQLFMACAHQVLFFDNIN